jgi:hypothetical protein
MYGQAFATKFEAKLRKLLSKNKQLGSTLAPFGGLPVIVYSGDFYQLPPVCDQPIYAALKNAAHKAGHILFQEATEQNTVVLEKIQLTSDDVYAKLQEQVRLGQWETTSNGNMAVINSRYHAPFENAQSPADDYVPIIVSKNLTRQRQYEAQMKLISSKLMEAESTAPILLEATFQPRKLRSAPVAPADLSPQELHFLQQQPDSMYERMPGALFIYVGAPILFSHNLPLEYGIANGTRGRIVGWQFPPGTEFTLGEYRGVKVRIPTAKVDFVLVQIIASAELKKPPNQPPGLGRNIIAMPMVNRPIKESIVLPGCLRRLNNRSRGLCLNITQVPIRQALVLTTYSVQGNQYNRFIIAECDPKQFYIPFSRGKQGLGSISLCFELDKKYIAKAVPSADLAAAMSRYKEYHVATKARYPM